MKKNEIKLLTDREHVLLRPARYIGSTKTEEIKTWSFDKNKGLMSMKTTKTNPAFKKIFREILDNSIDEYVRTGGKFANKIKIIINQKKNEIILEDNGRGIPFSEHKDGNKKITGAELAWTRLKAGSNFDDSDDNKTLGQNGEGASLTNILSTSFKGETCDGKQKVTVQCNDNMGKINSKIEPGVKKFTRVTYQPDLEKFKLPEIPDYMVDSIEVDIMTITQVYSKMNILLTTIDKQGNKSEMEFSSKTTNFKTFTEYFLEETEEPKVKNYEVIEEDGIKIAIFDNNTDVERIFHSINGLTVTEGSPLRWVINSISKPLLEKLIKKHKNLKTGDFRQKLSFIIIFTKMTNPRFNSQTKENCVNTYTDFKNNIGNINFSQLSERVYRKRSSILDSLTTSQSITDMILDKKALKELKPETKKRVVIDKYYKTSGDHRKEKIGLVLTEGDSALQGVIDTLGRETFSYFPLKGKPLNVVEEKNNVITKNQEIKNILQILELDITKDKPTMKYDSVIIATDADPDGAHITGLLLALFYRFVPEMVKQGKIKLFKTPMIVATPKSGRGKKKLIYSFKELFREEENEGFKKKYDLHYYKGLGSWAGEDLNNLIKENGINNFIMPFKEKKGFEFQEIMENWFKKENTDFRKEQINKENFNIGRA